MNKIFGKSCKTILIATLIYILYVAFVVMPFFIYASPPNEATSIWKFSSAPLVFALLFYPVPLLHAEFHHNCAILRLF